MSHSTCITIRCTGRALDLELNVHGAPNFRTPKLGNLNVFGVAQPRSQGLRAILSILRCKASIPDPYSSVWFSTREEPIGLSYLRNSTILVDSVSVYISGRSFVLRDASEPRKTMHLSDRAENLEGIEERLKNDILQESLKYGGLILTHNEIASMSYTPLMKTKTFIIFYLSRAYRRRCNIANMDSS